MSRGPGRIQRAILALIESDAHGAWLVSDICKREYAETGRVEKKHQVAVNRALSNMALPEPWEVRYSGSRGNMRVLYNTRDAESRARAEWLTRHDSGWEEFIERRKNAEPKPEDEPSVPERTMPPRRDELAHLEERIQRTKANIAFLESVGDHSAIRQWSEELRSLEKRRNKLRPRMRAT
jgi:hypothetical protein